MRSVKRPVASLPAAEIRTTARNRPRRLHGESNVHRTGRKVPASVRILSMKDDVPCVNIPVCSPSRWRQRALVWAVRLQHWALRPCRKIIPAYASTRFPLPRSILPLRSKRVHPPLSDPFLPTLSGIHGQSSHASATQSSMAVWLRPCLSTATSRLTTADPLLGGPIRIQPTCSPARARTTDCGTAMLRPDALSFNASYPDPPACRAVTGMLTMTACG